MVQGTTTKSTPLYMIVQLELIENAKVMLPLNLIQRRLPLLTYESATHEAPTTYESATTNNMKLLLRVQPEIIEKSRARVEEDDMKSEQK